MKPDEAKTTPTEPIDEASRADRPAEPRPTAAGEPASHELATSRVREPGRYRVIGEHGRGGLGRVSRVHDRELGRDVAIKELISRTSTNEARFLREAMITARLEHPAIVPVYEAGRWPDGTPFYAMKLVSGRPLRELIAERRTIAERLHLLHHVIAVADAMAYAHDRNIIHRDLKPANVLVGDFGETVVIDWGLAKDLTEAEELPGAAPQLIAATSDLTATGSVIGTPAYMAPEQGRGEQVDQRADVFAIGAMLWELCSLDKVPPRDARHRHRLLRRAGIDRDLAVIVDKALELAPERRYSDAGALAADLKAFKSGTRIAARDYTLLAMLAHWTRRHRVLAASIATAVALLVAITIFYIRDITTARARADAALADSQLQTRRAIIGNAAALLERDPTQAWQTIAPLGEAPDTTVLRARIKAAGVADATWQLHSVISEHALTPSGDWFVFATFDRRMGVIDLQTHSMRILPEQTTLPAVVTATDKYAYIVYNANHLILTRIALATGVADDLIDLAELPAELEVGDAGVFWRSHGGVLHQVSSDHTDRAIATNVEHFAVAGRELVICSNRGGLTIGEPGRAQLPHGPCMETDYWSVRPRSLAYPVDANHIAVYSEGAVQRTEFPKGRTVFYLGLSDTGLISALDTLRGGEIRLPGAMAFQQVQLEKPAINTDSRGSVVTWALADGMLDALDTETHRRWSLRAQGNPTCMWVLPGNRILTCGLTDIRLWKIPPGAAMPVAKLPAGAFTVAVNDDGSELLDGDAGDASLMRPGETGATALHKHTQPSFGAAWCDSRACTGSWDGQILCSSPDGKTTSVIADYGAAVRWLTGSGGHCFAAVANGAIYDLRSPATPLYRHNHEPHRVVISHDQARVASGDWNGAVKVWDVARHRIIAERPHLHSGRVAGLAWVDSDHLATVGNDGHVNLLSPELNVLRSWNTGVPISYLKTFDNAIYTALADGTIWIASLTNSTEYRISLKTEPSTFDVSPHENTIAVGTSSGELFLIDARHRIFAYRFDRGPVSFTHFEDEQTILVCAWDGRVVRFAITPQLFESPTE